MAESCAFHAIAPSMQLHLPCNCTFHAIAGQVERSRGSTPRKKDRVTALLQCIPATWQIWSVWRLHLLPTPTRTIAPASCFLWFFRSFHLVCSSVDWSEAPTSENVAPVNQLYESRSHFCSIVQYCCASCGGTFQTLCTKNGLVTYSFGSDTIGMFSKLH
jgi:hypothetical protein